MVKQLFDGSDGSEEDVSNFEVNKEFARRYEHNNKRADLQRLDEMKKKGLVSSDESSSDESTEGELINSKTDLEFLNALIKVKNQDPHLKNVEAKLFESQGEERVNENEQEREIVKRGKKEKPMYLKDVTAMHLMEEGPEFEEKEEKKLRVKSYSEEQEEMRTAFLNAVEALDDDDDELLKEKVSGSMGVEGEDEDHDSEEVKKKLDEYFGKDDNLDHNEMFLKEYLGNRMWVDEDNGKKALDGDVFGLSEDEQEIEKQEEYESKFNFRFEENAGDRVLGHSRFVEGSVRKKANARKVQRKSKKERMAQAEFEREEELKHLKNLKKKEMNEKLRKIKDTAGIGENWVCPLDEDDLEEEFDPEKYDRKMSDAFNDEYYDDVDPEFGSDRDEDNGEFEKPDFAKEDELLGLPKGWDDAYHSADGFLAVRERNLKRRSDSEGNHEQIDKSKKKKKQKVSQLEKEVLNKELEEYYKLDYEDTIGDLKTRFKYKEVGAKKYGLSTKEILMLDDKELNQYVSVKKLAPYMEKEWKVPRDMRYQQKQRIKLLLQGELLEDHKIGKRSLQIEDKKSTEVAVSAKHEKSQAEESNGEMSNLSRRMRRKRRQAEIKLSQSRLVAYGKIPSKSKTAKRH